MLDRKIDTLSVETMKKDQNWFTFCDTMRKTKRLRLEHVLSKWVDREQKVRLSKDKKKSPFVTGE